MSPRRFRQSAWPRRWRNETMDGSETNWLQYWRPIAEIGILSVAIYYTLTFFGAHVAGQLSSPSSAC